MTSVPGLHFSWAADVAHPTGSLPAVLLPTQLLHPLLGRFQGDDGKTSPSLGETTSKQEGTVKAPESAADDDRPLGLPCLSPSRSKGHKAVCVCAHASFRNPAEQEPRFGRGSSKLQAFLWVSCPVVSGQLRSIEAGIFSSKRPVYIPAGHFKIYPQWAT